MPSGKRERGTCLSMVEVWFGRVAVSPGAMIECVIGLVKKL